MISVVICSAKTVLARQVKLNIDNTIGVPWEAIIIDNSSASNGITSVYNLGVKKSSFAVICFVHEDVEFVTCDWGKKLLAYFDNDSELGMVGLAGAGYKSKTLSGWMTCIEAFDRYNITHKNGSGNNLRMLFDQGPAEALKNVLTLDGVFLCTRKDIIETIPFDQENLTGFHLYDIDISFRISRLYKVKVSFEIDIIHYTEGGDFGDKWVENTLSWHKKYEDKLPATLEKYAWRKIRQIEYKICLFWLKRLRNEKISVRNKIRWIWVSRAILKVGMWPHVILLFLFRPIRSILKYRQNE